MAKKKQLRKLRTNTVINMTSKQQEKDIGVALNKVICELEKMFSLKLQHFANWKLSAITSRLEKHYPGMQFVCHHETSSMRPDGGILSLVANDNKTWFPILISEVKNQGTNDQRAKEGLKKQAKGNAIERLGKNVIGFRTALLNECIIPFVCFGYGCDFTDDSSILDRVSTISMFAPLNEVSVANEGPDGLFNRGSFFFRESEWSVDEMYQTMFEIAKRSIYYYYSKYGEEYFQKI